MSNLSEKLKTAASVTVFGVWGVAANFILYASVLVPIILFHWKFVPTLIFAIVCLLISACLPLGKVVLSLILMPCGLSRVLAGPQDLWSIVFYIFFAGWLISEIVHIVSFIAAIRSSRN